MRSEDFPIGYEYYDDGFHDPEIPWEVISGSQFVNGAKLYLCEQKSGRRSGLFSHRYIEIKDEMRQLRMELDSIIRSSYLRRG